MSDVGYIRVSTIDQNTGRQLADKKLDKIFQEHASGKTKARPVLAECLRYLREGDTLFVHSIDRLARSLYDLKTIVNELVDKGVTVCFSKENLTFKAGKIDPMSDLLLGVLGSFAEFERAVIRERQKEGIEQAKMRGVYLGRKESLSQQDKKEIKKIKESGVSVSELARRFKVSRPTIYCALAE